MTERQGGSDVGNGMHEILVPIDHLCNVERIASAQLAMAHTCTCTIIQGPLS